MAIGYKPSAALFFMFYFIFSPGFFFISLKYYDIQINNKITDIAQWTLDIGYNYRRHTELCTPHQWVRVLCNGEI